MNRDLDAIRNRMTQALMTAPPAPAATEWSGPVMAALALACRFGACARAAGAEVGLRSVGTDAFGVPFATYSLGDRVTTLELTDPSRVIEGLAELAGAAA